MVSQYLTQNVNPFFGVSRTVPWRKKQNVLVTDNVSDIYSPLSRKKFEAVGKCVNGRSLHGSVYNATRLNVSFKAISLKTILRIKSCIEENTENGTQYKIVSDVSAHGLNHFIGKID